MTKSYQTCGYCEFCFPKDNGFVCAGDQYDEDITNSIDEVKPCYKEGLDAYSERIEAEAVKYDYKPIGEFYIDGRRTYELKDLNKVTIRVRGSILKKHFSDIPVIRTIEGVVGRVYEVSATYSVDAKEPRWVIYEKSEVIVIQT